MLTRRSMVAATSGLLLSGGLMHSRLMASELAEDVDILRRAFTLLHPGLYRYNSPAEMDARFDALAAAWAQPQTSAQAYLSLSRMLASVKCGHTYANFLNQSQATIDTLFSGKTRLPFLFTWIENEMVVTDPAGAPGLSAGDVIKTVNGTPAPDILQSVLPFARADGNNDAKRIAQMAVGGGAPYESFDIYHGLLAPPPDTIVLTLVKPDGMTARLEVEPIDLAGRQAQGVSEGGDGDAPIFSLDHDASGAAILTMPTWAVFNSSWDWKTFIDRAMDEVIERGAPKLVIDIRGNEGGLSCGDRILSRLIDEDLKPAGSNQLVRYQTTPADLDPYLETWDDSFRDITAFTEPFDDMFFRVKSDNTPPVRPRGTRYTGDVVVLVDASNSSATFNFANVIQSRGLGRLVGMPTGGNRRGINGSYFFFLTLPNSGLETDLPLVGGYPLAPQPDRGVLPDITVQNTAADIAAGRDRVLETALARA